MNRPCQCAEHREVKFSLTVEGHKFNRQEDYGDGYWWRWTCSCGSRGQWQCQSSDAAYHAWLRHVET